MGILQAYSVACDIQDEDGGGEGELARLCVRQCSRPAPKRSLLLIRDSACHTKSHFSNRGIPLLQKLTFVGCLNCDRYSVTPVLRGQTTERHQCTVHVL